MEERGLAASTIDRRLSTVCGFYRFAHIDGRIGSTPAGNDCDVVHAAGSVAAWRAIRGIRTKRRSERLEAGVSAPELPR